MTDESLEWKADSYQLEAWVMRMGGLPKSLVAHSGGYSDYTMNAAHVFEIHRGRYALVIEEGCSCYSAADARIYIYGSKKDALADFKDWENDRKNGSLTWQVRGVLAG